VSELQRNVSVTPQRTDSLTSGYVWQITRHLYRREVSSETLRAYC